MYFRGNGQLCVAVLAGVGLLALKQKIQDFGHEIHGTAQIPSTRTYLR